MPTCYPACRRKPQHVSMTCSDRQSEHAAVTFAVRGGSSMDDRRTVLLLERDLFFSVKIRDTLRHQGYETLVARGEDDFARKLAASAPALVIVNTGIVGVAWEQVIARAKAAGVPTLAFGSHID